MRCVTPAHVELNPWKRTSPLKETALLRTEHPPVRRGKRRIGSLHSRKRLLGPARGASLPRFSCTVLTPTETQSKAWRSLRHKRLLLPLLAQNSPESSETLEVSIEMGNLWSPGRARVTAVETKPVLKSSRSVVLKLPTVLEDCKKRGNAVIRADFWLPKCQ